MNLRWINRIFCTRRKPVASFKMLRCNDIYAHEGTQMHAIRVKKFMQNFRRQNLRIIMICISIIRFVPARIATANLCTTQNELLTRCTMNISGSVLRRAHYIIIRIKCLRRRFVLFFRFLFLSALRRPWQNVNNIFILPFCDFIILELNGLEQKQQFTRRTAYTM